MNGIRIIMLMDYKRIFEKNGFGIKLLKSFFIYFFMVTFFILVYNNKWFYLTILTGLSEDFMITLSAILISAALPFILVFILGRIIIHFTEKVLDFLIEKVFSLPEKILDSIKEKFKNKGKLPEAVEIKE